MFAVATEKTASSTQAPPVEEPFGQAGMRRFIGPVFVILTTIVAIVSGALWYRSTSFVDSVAAWPVDGAVWRVSSIYGRIVVSSFDAPPGDRGSKAMPLQWTYETGNIQPGIKDWWRPSLQKSLGIEWRHAPLTPFQPQTAHDFWLRIQWRTITILLAIVPVVHVIRNRYRRNHEDQVAI